MNCPAKPTQRTVEPEAPTRASVPERFRRLKWNEVVWSCDFVADERLGLQPWEGPSGFRAGSFARPIYRREEIVRFRASSTKKTKQNTKHRCENTHWLTKIATSSTTRQSMRRWSKSGQSLSPCVEVNGHMLADFSGDEVEAYLLKAGVVQPTAASADQPGLRRPSP